MQVLVGGSKDPMQVLVGGSKDPMQFHFKVIRVTSCIIECV